MADQSASLPTDIDALHALIRAERSALASMIAARDAAFAERDQLAARNAKLEHILAEIRRAHFGRKSECISDDQLALALEDLEAALAKDEAKDEKADPALRVAGAHKRRTSRVLNFDHLPHEEVVIEPESMVCPCCGGALHIIGEDTSRRLDKVPAKIRVIATHRPKYACRPARMVWCRRPRPRASSRAGCRLKRSWPTSSYRSMPITSRSIASRRSWPGTTFPSSALPWRSGSGRARLGWRRSIITWVVASRALASCFPTRRRALGSIPDSAE